MFNLLATTWPFRRKPKRINWFDYRQQCWGHALQGWHENPKDKWSGSVSLFYSGMFNWKRRPEAGDWIMTRGRKLPVALIRILKIE